MQVERRHPEFFQGLKLADAGQQIKEVCGVLAEVRLAGQQAQIGVKPRGGRIVIAGGEMHVAPDAPGLGADHERDLGMDFISDQPVNDVDSGLLEPAGPFDVVGLVKSGAEFYDGGDLFAVIHGVHQGADDARVAPGAIESLFDGQHLRIFRGPFQKMNHAGEVLIRVMQEDVTLPDGGENVLLVPQRAGQRGHELRVAQLRRVVALA